jgi:hypothetical protein
MVQYIRGPRTRDLTAETFCRLTVKQFSHYGHNRSPYWVCECLCGVVKVIDGRHLNSGSTRSCGCLQKQVSTKHGMHGTTEYKAWACMHQRCYNKLCTGYDNYGGRGITVCDAWQSFACFYADMGPRPSKDHSLDRIDNDGPYCKENCRWATRKEQQRNRRSTQFVTCGNETLTLTQWAERTGIKYKTLCKRLNSGWPVEQALTQPVRRW